MTSNKVSQNKKAETHYLFWVNQENGKRQSAGVAFYDEKFGEYRLKLDILPEQQYFLRTVGSQDKKINYRAEIVLKKNGKYAGRRAIGEGYSKNEKPEEIFIDLGPFSKTLFLGTNK